MSECKTYIGTKACGCLRAAAVNNPEHKKDVAKAVAGMIRDGLSVELVETQAVREMSWTCEDHRERVQQAEGVTP